MPHLPHMVGAKEQPLHPDQSTDTLSVCSVFVALHDIDATMGPTLFVPRTHTAKTSSTDIFTQSSDGTEDGGSVPHAAMLHRGDAVLFDGRVHHRGGANTSPRRRSLLYISFMAPGQKPSSTSSPEERGSLLPELVGRTLGDKEWNAGMTRSSYGGAFYGHQDEL